MTSLTLRTSAERGPQPGQAHGPYPVHQDGSTHGPSHGLLPRPPLPPQPAMPPGPPLPRLLPGAAAPRHGGPIGLDDHLRKYGPMPLPGRNTRNGRRPRARLIDMVERSGLTGRGGAGFPTGRKLRSVASGGGEAVVVANGSEGEPASFKDRLLLMQLPHLVLDGISLAADTVGAREAHLCVHRGDGGLGRLLRDAVTDRWESGIDQVRIQVSELPDRYVASEQSAVVNYINGGPAKPTYSPPRTHESGVRGRPTLVNNVETLANIALIARYGDGWFRSAGLPSAPGSTLLTVGGAVRRPGVYEIALGTTIGHVLTLAEVTAPLQAVLTGGYFGSWLPAQAAWQIPLTHAALKAVGGALGAGILIALPESACGLAETARVLRYLADETAAQCGPCVMGLPALAGVVAEAAFEGGRDGGLKRAERLRRFVAGRGACRHPDGASQLAMSALNTFAADLRWHEQRGPCSGVRQAPLLPLPPGDAEGEEVGWR